MATTFEVYGGARPANYETLPTIDVEILPDVRHCDQCGGQIIYVADDGGSWKHVDDNVVEHKVPYIFPVLRCRYCHNEDGVVYRQHAWHDAIECPRCGGQDGHPVGD